MAVHNGHIISDMREIDFSVRLFYFQFRLTRSMVHSRFWEADIRSAGQ